MKLKTSELDGAVLDWAVFEVEFGTMAFEFSPSYSPSTDWSQAGPIIEREKINAVFLGGEWESWVDSNGVFCQGPTPLIAAMRCYVASKLGEEVEVPNGLA